MAIGDLLGKLKKPKEEPQKFLALEITDELVQAAVWQVEDGQTEVVTLGSPVEWDGDSQSESELLSAVDASISGAVEGLSPEPNQVVFGVASSWSTESGLSPDKLALLKKICAELELKALGFVIIIDSLLRYLKLQEGTPATSLIVQVYRRALTVTLIKLGKIQGSAQVARSENIREDTEEALSRLDQTEPFPSRILVFDGMHNLEEVVQSLVGVDWKGKFTFLHEPVVASLPRDVAIRAVSVAGGAEVAKSIGFDIVEKPAAIPESPSPPPSAPLSSAKDFGFSPTPTLPPSPESPAPPAPSTRRSPPALKMPRVKLPAFTLPSLKFKLPTPGRLPLALATAAILLLVGFLTASWYLPRASVIVQVEPKSLPENLTFTLSTEASSVDPLLSVIPATLLEHQVTGEETGTATGTKTIGDPAQGEVTVYNRTSLSKTFVKGTTLSSAGLSFTLNDDVVVASKSAGEDYVDVPGRATVAVTAVQIGEDSNLPADSEFALASFSKDTYVARNASAFSGGTSEEVTVVREADQASLLSTLQARLLEQAQTELTRESSAGTDTFILDDSAKVDDSSFSAAVGEPTSEFLATLTLSLRAVRYQIKDVESLVQEAVTRAIPPGYSRTDQVPQVKIEEASGDDEDLITANAQILVELIPQVDTADLQHKLRGHPSGELESILAGSVPGFSSASADISPSWLPPRWKRLPRNPANIAVFIQSTM